MIEARALDRSDISSVWSINRHEIVDHIYQLVDGDLILRKQRYDIREWPPGEAEKYTPILQACHASGGWCCGLFDKDRIVAAAVLDGVPLQSDANARQLVFLHVSHEHRGRGLGKRLFRDAAIEAGNRGIHRLYISATPSKRTVEFYRSLGCSIADHPDPTLFAMEPDDIHFEYQIQLPTRSPPFS